MGKYSDFERRHLETYDTPYSPAVPALLPHLPRSCYFIEPCAGAGKLVEHLRKHSHTCVFACDIEPRGPDIKKMSAHQIRIRKSAGKPRFITNPPFKDEMLFPILRHLAQMGETWLLLPADQMHNAKMSEYLRAWGRKVASIGRISWLDNGKNGKENFAWFCFDGTKPPSPTIFFERKP